MLVSVVASLAIIGASIDEKAFAIPVGTLINVFKLSVFVSAYMAIHVVLAIPLHRKRLVCFGSKYRRMVEGYFRSRLGIFLIDKQWLSEVGALLESEKVAAD